MKKKKILPDDYYNDGIFEMARFGKATVMRNNMTKEMHDKLQTYMINNYQKNYEEISNLVNEIKAIAINNNPYNMLTMAMSFLKMGLINIESEIQIKKENMHLNLLLKYLQAIYISIDSNQINFDRFEELEYYKLIELAEKLFMQFHIYLTSFSFANKTKYSEDELKFIIDSFHNSFVTGNRYSYFEINNLKELLTNQKTSFESCFDITLDQFIDGVEKIQFSFSHGINETMKRIDVDMKVFDSQETSDEEKARMRENIEDIIGLGLHDVSKITEWTQSFMDTLSYSIGKCSTFFSESEYSGWLIINNPMQRKPLIELDGKHYCLCIHEFMDNIYKIIIKNMRESKRQTAELVNTIQGQTLEMIVCNLLKNILPDSEIHTSNYYPINGTEYAENDILLFYDDNMLIIEAKSGNYTPDLAIENIDSNIASLKELVEKSSDQSERFYEYLSREQQCKIYNTNTKKGNTIKKEIDISKYNNIIKISVTLENFNHIEAKAEKIKLINLNNNTIIISLDDLRVYCHYFEKEPSKFFHFMRQRVLATQTLKLELNDELDHLGLYISKNMYSLEAESRDTDKTIWFGFREDLDRYFYQLYINDKNATKPKQELPKRIEEILKYCDNRRIKNSVTLTNFILDIDSKDKHSINDSIETMIDKVKVTHTLQSITHTGEVSLTLFIHCGNDECDFEDCLKNSYAVMNAGNIKEMLYVHLFYDKNKRIRDIKFEILKFENCRFDKNEILEIATILKRERIKKRGKVKIGRNEPCPCGSGKKYKKCCGF